MKWITLIGDEHLSLSQIKNIKRIDAIRVYNADGIVNRYCIEYPDGHIFYDFDKDLSDWRDVLEKIPFSASTVIMMLYTNAANVRKELLLLNLPHNVYVDNDFDIILSLKEFIKAGMPMEE